ncbi:MAG TPA: 4-hydroxy-tetrahydrodipicolinate synthase, partial [Patescibacteria group bacterium]|nr:4-hydroxy-tetrahydrodipicolinate synthase [Patescibacteria group bacterium]
CGSTGEAATLSKEEKLDVMRFTIERVAGRIKVIAGTGSYDTRASIELTKKAKEIGADAALIVTPYYNKPTQNGCFEHFKAIAEVDIPQILYNVPGRTATNVLPETQLKIAETCPNVIGTKEASANLEQIMEIIKHAPRGFKIYSGDDILSLPIIASGGHGSIAVISNYAPKKYGDLVRAALANDFTTARKLQDELLPFFKVNFIESNPIPVKAILTEMGMIEENYRLPLTKMSDKNKETLQKVLKDSKL